MSTNRIDLLRALGVDPEKTPLLKHVPPEPTTVAHGLDASTAALSDLSALFTRVEFSANLSFDIGRHKLVPGVVCIEQRAERILGDGIEKAGGVLLDGRLGRRGVASFDAPSGRVVVEVGPEGINVFDAGSAAEHLGALDEWRPLPSELPPIPSLDFVGEGWLRGHVTELMSSSSLVDRAAALGTVARLYVPDRALQQAVLARRKTDPSDVAGEWARALSPEQRDGLERLAIERAVRLSESLEEIDEEVPLTDLRALLYERDALASVQALLWLAGAGRRLAGELRGSDALALTKAGYFAPSSDLEDDELLAAVASNEPDAWWSDFGNG